MGKRERDLVNEWMDGHTFHIKNALTVLKNGHQSPDWKAEERLTSRYLIDGLGKLMLVLGKRPQALAR